jgi:large subunit ribosomal protein L29
LEGAEADYQKMRLDHSIKGLDNPIALREMRRDVARIKSEIRRREIALMTPEEIAKRSKIRARRKNK